MSAGQTRQPRLQSANYCHDLPSWVDRCFGFTVAAPHELVAVREASYKWSSPGAHHAKSHRPIPLVCLDRVARLFTLRVQ